MIGRAWAAAVLALAAALSLASPSAAQAPERGPGLSVEAAMASAASLSAGVAARKAAADAAARAVDAARAGLFPRLAGSLSGAYLPLNDQAGITVPKGALSSYPLTLPEADLTISPNASDFYFKGNLSFSQPLFAWGKIRDGIDLARAEAGLSRAQARGAASDAAREANRAYFAALLAERSSAILAEILAYADQIVADQAAQLDAGLATKAQLLSAKADRAELASQLAQARESAASAREALALLSGEAAASADLSSDFRNALPQSPEAELKAAAASSSTPLAEASARLAQAERRLGLAEDSTILKPDLALFASLDTAGTSVPYSKESWTDGWSLSLSLGLSAKVDFFDGGASAAAVKEARAGAAAAKAALLAAGQEARLEARRALDAGRGAEAALEAARAKAEFAAESLSAVEAQAADQLASRSQLLGARLREAGARLGLLQARYALEEAAADLDRIGGALGDGAPRAAPRAAAPDTAAPNAAAGGTR